jgi:muconate cycloisomerase
MRDVRIALDTPITADESCWTPQDVMLLARENAVDTICLKPVTRGGLFLCRRMAEIAEAAGIGVLLGSKHPLSPGTSAFINFAAAIPAVHNVGEVFFCHHDIGVRHSSADVIPVVQIVFTEGQLWILQPL